MSTCIYTKIIWHSGPETLQPLSTRHLHQAVPLGFWCKANLGNWSIRLEDAAASHTALGA